jgi:hypothetical protein
LGPRDLLPCAIPARQVPPAKLISLVIKLRVTKNKCRRLSCLWVCRDLRLHPGVHPDLIRLEHVPPIL